MYFTRGLPTNAAMFALVNTVPRRSTQICILTGVANVRSLDLLPLKIITPSGTRSYPPALLLALLLLLWVVCDFLPRFTKWIQSLEFWLGDEIHRSVTLWGKSSMLCSSAGTGYPWRKGLLNKSSNYIPFMIICVDIAWVLKLVVSHVSNHITDFAYITIFFIWDFCAVSSIAI